MKNKNLGERGAVRTNTALGQMAVPKYSTNLSGNNADDAGIPRPAPWAQAQPPRRNLEAGADMAIGQSDQESMQLPSQTLSLIAGEASSVEQEGMTTGVVSYSPKPFLTPRQKKIFQLGLRIQQHLYIYPSAALNGARRLERIVNGKPPFSNSPSNTTFNTLIGRMRVL